MSKAAACPRCLRTRHQAVGIVCTTCAAMLSTAKLQGLALMWPLTSACREASAQNCATCAQVSAECFAPDCRLTVGPHIGRPSTST